MSDHTPGPWILATSCSWRRILTRDGVAVITPTNHPVDNHPDLSGREADLELAARAPDLLAEVERLQADVAEYEAVLAWAEATDKEQTAEIEALAHDLERHMTIANQVVNENEKLRETLEFYATPDNWRSPSKGFALQYDPTPSPIDGAGKWVPAARALQAEGSDRNASESIGAPGFDTPPEKDEQ